MADAPRSGNPDRHDAQEQKSPRKKAIREETRKIRHLQRVVALAQQMLATQVETKGEAITVMNGAKDYALGLFPEKGDTFDIIYGTRLMRIYRARFDRDREAG
ncbi:MAG: hypothetical protein R6W82_02240 [bacterium]